MRSSRGVVYADQQHTDHKVIQSGAELLNETEQSFPCQASVVQAKQLLLAWQTITANADATFGYKTPLSAAVHWSFWDGSVLVQATPFTQCLDMSNLPPFQETTIAGSSVSRCSDTRTFTTNHVYVASSWTRPSSKTDCPGTERDASSKVVLIVRGRTILGKSRSNLSASLFG